MTKVGSIETKSANWSLSILSYATKYLYSALYQLNNFFKGHDPFPDFPLPKVYANRGGGAARAAAAYRPSYIPAQYGYDATINAAIRTGIDNALGANLPATTSGNSGNAPRTWTPGSLAWTEAQRYYPNHGNPLSGAFGPDTSTYNPYNSNNIYNPDNAYRPGPFQSVVRSYSQMADTNNFGYQHGPSFANSSLSSPFSSPFTSPTISPITSPSFSNNPFSFSSVVPSSSITSPPSFSTNSFSTITRTEFNFERVKFEPLATIQTMPSWSSMPSMPPAPAPFREIIHGFSAEELAQQRAQYEAEQQAKKEAERVKESTKGLDFYTQSPEAKRQYDAWRVEVVNEISSALKHLYGMLYAHNIWVDINYIHNILFLPIELVVNLLESGCLADLLLERARIKPYQSGQATVSSGSNNAGNSTDFGDVIKELLEERNNLDGHEYGSHDGHVKSRHISIPKEQLERRLKRQLWIQGATSFPDLNTANKYVWETLRRNEDNIREWFLNSKKPYDFFAAEFSETVGYGYNRAGQYSAYINTIRVKLVRNGQHIFVQTAYPLCGK